MFVNNSTLNTTRNSTSTSPVTQENIASLVILSIIIVVGVIGNAFVVMVVSMIPSMRTTTNFLLLNVAVADIITLLLIAIHRGTRNIVPASDFMCKVIEPNTFTNVAVLATGLTLTVLAVERYNALVKPMRISRRLTTDNVSYVIIGIWVVSMVMAMPMLIYIEYEPRSRPKCTADRNLNNLLISVGCVAFSMTIIPFLVIAFSYSQIISGLYFSNTIWSSNNPGTLREDLVAKRKLVQMLVTVTVVFFIAFVPYGVLQILKLSLNGKINENMLQNLKNLTLVMKYLMPLHSSINPLLYTLQSQNYRDGFVFVVQKMFCKGGEGGARGGELSRGEQLRSCSHVQDPATVFFCKNHVVLQPQEKNGVTLTRY